MTDGGAKAEGRPTTPRTVHQKDLLFFAQTPGSMPAKTNDANLPSFMFTVQNLQFFQVFQRSSPWPEVNFFVLSYYQ